MVRAAVERAGEGVTFSRAERVKNRVAQYLARELGSSVCTGNLGGLLNS